MQVQYVKHYILVHVVGTVEKGQTESELCVIVEENWMMHHVKVWERALHERKSISFPNIGRHYFSKYKYGSIVCKRYR
jgi:hypothetical protein